MRLAISRIFGDIAYPPVGEYCKRLCDFKRDWLHTKKYSGLPGASLDVLFRVTKNQKK